MQFHLLQNTYQRYSGKRIVRVIRIYYKETEKYVMYELFVMESVLQMK
ncbi:hypothetical protein ACUXG3_004372 [Bacillus thuringiensis]